MQIKRIAKIKTLRCKKDENITINERTVKIYIEKITIVINLLVFSFLKIVTIAFENSKIDKIPIIINI
jgi:hypothetical protein